MSHNKEKRGRSAEIGGGKVNKGRSTSTLWGYSTTEGGTHSAKGDGEGGAAGVTEGGGQEQRELLRISKSRKEAKIQPFTTKRRKGSLGKT